MLHEEFSTLHPDVRKYMNCDYLNEMDLETGPYFLGNFLLSSIKVCSVDEAFADDDTPGLAS